MIGFVLILNRDNSRQIRPPIYSMKQSKLRRKRVFRYAVLYFVMLVVFVGLIVGPLVAGKFVPSSVTRSLGSTNLLQPTGLDNNNTNGRKETGTGAAGYSGVLKASMTSSAASSKQTSNNNKLKLA